jgi:drug/metabolite transporter (DMT)-like permease
MDERPAQGGASPSPYRGILIYILAGVGFTFLDGTAKWLAQDYHVLQVVWARYVFHTAILAFFMPREMWLRPFASARPGLQLARSILLMVATLFFFFSLQYLQLAEATSVGFSAPLILTALAYFILREKVGPRRWTAVIVGFIGVLIVIRPGTGALHWAAFATLACAISNAGYQLITRMLSGVDSPRTTLFYSGLVGAIGMSLIVPFVWTTPTAIDWVKFVFVGVMGAAGHFCLIKAYGLAQPSLLAPYSYVQIVWVIALGFVMFGDLPDFWTLVGTAIIIGSGIYVFYREAYLRRVGRI